MLGMVFCSDIRYRPLGQSGRLKADRPIECPLADASCPCQIIRHGAYLRKQGPGHPLARFRCKIHRKTFTAYPPGWGPHLRVPLMICDPVTGRRVEDDHDDGTSTLPGALYEKYRFWCI